jgi:hypothetical protein
VPARCPFIQIDSVDFVMSEGFLPAGLIRAGGCRGTSGGALFLGLGHRGCVRHLDDEAATQSGDETRDLIEGGNPRRFLDSRGSLLIDAKQLPHLRLAERAGFSQAA